MNIYLAETSSRPYLYASLFGGRQWKTGIYPKRTLNGGGGGQMDIYLAGGVTGNLNPLWKEIAIGGGKMNLYLAGNHTIKNTLAITEIGGGAPNS